MSGKDDYRPKMLDLYCKAGGASYGYYRAGFDVVGVDIEPQPHYPFTFIQADARDVLEDLAFLRSFDARHASPPCQDFSVTRHLRSTPHGTADLLGYTMDRLAAAGGPSIVENVPGAEQVMGFHLRLCGSSFGLGVRRHRLFALSWFMLAPPCVHDGRPVVDVTGHGRGVSHARRAAGRRHYKFSQAERREAMGIDWMNRDELAQAIPPAYTQFIGESLLAVASGRADEVPA